jgi:hypothetical protein
MVEEIQNRGMSRMPQRIQTMKKKPTPTRGGARKGAGRKPGTGTGRTVTTSSINLPPELWDMLDALRGELTRSAWIAAKIKNARL